MLHRLLSGLTGISYQYLIVIIIPVLIQWYLHQQKWPKNWPISKSANTILPLGAIRGTLFLQTRLFQNIFNFSLICFLFPLTEKFNAILSGLSSVFNVGLCPNHPRAFAFAVIFIDTVKPSIVTNSLPIVFFLHINFIPQTALNIALSVLFKISTSSLFEHYVSLSYSMPDCTQLD